MIDLDAVEAIDFHVHVEQDGRGRFSLDDQLLNASSGYFRSSENRTPTVEYLANYYRERRMAAVVFTVDATTGLGRAPLDIENVLDTAADFGDVLIPFASVDPHDPNAPQRARHLVQKHGARGFKFHPSLQAFAPNDPEYTSLWAAIEELEVPALFHTGQTGIGAGLPGGRGIKLRYSAPMLLDDIAADFPGLTIVMAHPSVPWQDEAISIATHKTNVYIDLSGWSPKYFPEPLLRAATGVLRDKVLFGTDFPLLTPDRWIADFETVNTKPELLPRLLKENAARVLGIAS